MGSNRELPTWALPLTVIVCVAVLALIGWRVFGGNGEVGPSKKVYPGMYDLRKEIQQSRAAREQQGGAHNQ